MASWCRHSENGRFTSGGIIVVGLSTGACAFAANYWQLLIWRSLGGVGSTMFTVSAVARLIRLTPPALRGRSTSLWSTSFLLGGVTGPLVGGGLIGISLRTPFVVYAVALFVPLPWLGCSCGARRWSAWYRPRTSRC